MCCRSILGQGATRLAAIEKDPRFLPSLHLLREASGDRLDTHPGDALYFNMANIFPHSLARDWTAEPPDIRVLGNLPFNVASCVRTGPGSTTTSPSGGGSRAQA